MVTARLQLNINIFKLHSLVKSKELEVNFTKPTRLIYVTVKRQSIVNLERWDGSKISKSVTAQSKIVPYWFHKIRNMKHVTV